MQDSYQENYYADWTQIQETQNTSYQRNNGHRVGVRLDHKFSDNTSILFQPQFNYSQGGSSSCRTSPATSFPKGRARRTTWS